MKNCSFFTLLFILINNFAFAQNQWKDVYSENEWIARDKWQQPSRLIDFLNIKAGSTVADVGCHQGYMTFKLAEQVGEQGKVFAVDVDQFKLNILKVLLEKRKVTNVTLVKGEYDNPKLEIEELDAVVILDTYHEMDDHDKILQHIKTALKPGGRLVICEPIADARRELPRSDQEKRHELGMNFAVEDLKKAGYKILVNEDNFINREKEKGDKMWVIVASR